MVNEFIMPFITRELHNHPLVTMVWSCSVSPAHHSLGDMPRVLHLRESSMAAEVLRD